MLRKFLVLGVATCVVSSVFAAERMPVPAPTLDHDSPSSRIWTTTGESCARVAIGDPAPGFSFMVADGSWHGFKQLLADGPVVLVFGARDRELSELDQVRSLFGDLGVSTVMVLDMGSGSAARHARRLALGSEVIADPQCAIGGLYGTLHPITGRNAPAYFVVDERGTLRGFGRGTLPSPRQLLAISARSLGRPLPESAWSSPRE